MTGKAEVYEVQTLNNGRWTIQSRCRTEQQAIAEAHEFFDRRHCVGVKVVKEAFDETARLYREFTVFRLPASSSLANGKARSGPGAAPGQAAAKGASAAAPSEVEPSPRRRFLQDIFSGLRSLTSP